MTVEQRINKYLEAEYGKDFYIPIEDWRADILSMYSEKVFRNILKIIREADTIECLTSKSEFIREVKKNYEIQREWE